ncbi:Hypothetical protein FKW44_018144 [Caligus rogercresseyi]|uniref:Uncharacterized protein n=1 Tax=Caligus rogercresseyi TaxID=217165 RepID=A0A7T8GU05_CALRO|nr:Hypothetical protein FKW44_018144 [Caligus rogercresseyi]
MPGLSKAHIEDARGDNEHNKTYCSKDEIFRTWGEVEEQETKEMTLQWWSMRLCLRIGIGRS